MTGSLLFAVLVALPVVYLRGRRTGFERHQCSGWLPASDRAPTQFLEVPCSCGTSIPCQLTVVTRGGLDVEAALDLTDYRAHRIRHEGAV